jgi:hypothetical protein
MTGLLGSRGEMKSFPRDLNVLDYSNYLLWRYYFAREMNTDHTTTSESQERFAKVPTAFEGLEKVLKGFHQL